MTTAQIFLIASVIGVVAIDQTFAVHDAKSALRISIQKINDESLSAVAAERPESCRITGPAGWAWKAQCLVTLEKDRPAECRVQEWKISRWGNPSPTVGRDSLTTSMRTGCYFQEL